MPIVKAVCEPQEQSTDAADSARPARDYKALFSTKWIVINTYSAVKYVLLVHVVAFKLRQTFYLTFVLLFH